MADRPDTSETPDDPGTPRELPATLSRIVARKREEVAEAKSRVAQSRLEEMVRMGEAPRNFFAAVTKPYPPRRTAVIAEVKRRSPSAGLIRPEYDGDSFEPEAIAQAYYEGGASAISCLTDRDFFGGDLSFIRRIKDRVPLPVLRKDFIIDPYQVWEAAAAGADAILLIAECLREAELVDMLILAQQLRLTTLLEVHDIENLLRVRPYVGFPHAGYALLGINNRDLTTMTVDLAHTLRLADMVEDRSILVSESGIRVPADIKRLRQEGIRIVLVGESLMRDPEPGQALRRLLGISSARSGKRPNNPA
jgi:indole-3-glycerol phosphate synthase